MRGEDGALVLFSRASNGGVVTDAGVTDGADVTVTVPRHWETATRLSLRVIDGGCRSQEPQSHCKGSRTEAMADGQAGPGWIHGRRGRVSGNVRVGVDRMGPCGRPEKEARTVMQSGPGVTKTSERGLHISSPIIHPQRSSRSQRSFSPTTTILLRLPLLPHNVRPRVCIILFVLHALTP